MSKRLCVILLLIAFAIGLGLGIVVGAKRGVPFVGSHQMWTIGVYQGDSPLDLEPIEGVTQPVLTKHDVTDIEAEFVADPFMIRVDGKWHMFFEVINAASHHGDIALATSADGIEWTYERVVLDEPFHLSYPCVFHHDESYYMIPETNEANAIRLYRAEHFPTRWTHVADLVEGAYIDATPFQHDERWWMFALLGQGDLHLFSANELVGPWTEHPQSPVIKDDPNIARPGGRVVTYEDRLYRFTQDTYPTYGNQVRAFEITDITIDRYVEEESTHNPIVTASGDKIGWNSLGMHQIDAHQIEDGDWIACVDGYGVWRVYGWNH